MKNTICFLCLAIWFAWGCDPMRRINMKNRTDEKAEITWHIIKDSILSSPFFMSNSREVKFKMLPDGKSGDIKMSFGIGKWTPQYLAGVVDDLDSVEIKWNNKISILRTQEEMLQFLSERRRSLDKSKIHITLKKD